MGWERRRDSDGKEKKERRRVSWEGRRKGGSAGQEEKGRQRVWMEERKDSDEEEEGKADG